MDHLKGMVFELCSDEADARLEDEKLLSGEMGNNGV